MPKLRVTQAPALAVPCADTQWYFGGLSRANARGDATAAAALGGSAISAPIIPAALLECFFTQRLMQQRQASKAQLGAHV